MDARSPLLDMFRRGEVPREIKMLAARGTLAPGTHQQLMLLVELVSDADTEIRQAAEQTINAIPRGPLESFLALSDTPPAMREFFAARGVAASSAIPVDGDESVVDTSAEAEPPAEFNDAEASEVARQGVVQRLAALKISERVKVAMTGSREERVVLIRDPNKLVSAAVLSSPKLTGSEVENFAKMGNLSDEVLRIIGTTRRWVKNYGVVSGLTRNPKTPIAVALNLVQRLNERDLKAITLDRNIQEPLKVAARKLLKPGRN